MRRITVSLLDHEREALYRLAVQERRNIREQGALLIRQELERRGLLPDDTAVTGARHDQ